MSRDTVDKWATRRLRDLTTKIGSGATPRGGRQAYKETGIALIRSQNVFDMTFDPTGLALIDTSQAAALSNVEVQGGDVLLNITGASVARCCLVPPNVLPARVNQHVAIVRADPSVLDSEFLLYSLNSPQQKQQLLTLAQGGATREALTKDTIGDFQIPLPQVKTQRKVAAILSAYDDLIEVNRRRIEILEEMARRLYREWFVHFRFPGHEGVRFVDTAVGRIPEGWEVVKVREVATTHRGRSYRSSDLVAEGGLPFLNLKCVDREGGFRGDGLKRYSGQYQNTHLAAPGDIVIAVTDVTQERRIVARAARVPDIGETPFVYSMDLVKVAPAAYVPSDYLYGMFRFSVFADEVKQFANGVNVLHLHPDRIGDFSFAIAPLWLQETYASFAGASYAQRDVLRRQCDLLRRARDMLLPKLVGGEVDVEGVEAAGAEATR